jgi:hypothetical protein
MHPTENLADHDHPRVQAAASQLTSTKTNQMEQLEAIFHYVRDEIIFGFPPKWDLVKASETLEYQLGYCNTKATLFHALCRSAGIPSRVHTALIDINIMRGIFPGFAFPFLPETGGHSWTEVEIDGEWKPIDSYINDRNFYQNAKIRLHESGKETGFSISEARGASSCEFNFGEKGFVQMGAVIEDHGSWEDYSVYMASDKYPTMNRLLLTLYPIIAMYCNRTVAGIRAS